MRVASKIICWLFLAFLLFIITNLVIWVIQYWWTKNYSKYLNEKNRDDSIQQVYILRPKTWLSIFYEIDSVNIEINNNEDNNIENINSNEILSGDIEIEEKEINHNPYDPDYEDEFNSFFWVSSEETWNIISVQEIENIEDLWDAWFKLDENAED